MMLYLLVELNVVQVVQSHFRFGNQLNAPKATRSLFSSFALRSSSFSEDLVRERFRATMINNSTSIFSSWSNYEKSLPRRKYLNENFDWAYLPLYTLNYYARDDDLERFANEISKPPKQISQIRTLVKYITAPTSTGKTSCVLPAFLKTTLTHYIFIAFSNNADNNYKVRETFNINYDPDIAHAQGADFIFECVKIFLDSPLPEQHIIEGNPNPSTFQETRAALEKYLIDKLGEDHQCLFHLDEYRKMCPRSSDEGTGKDFSRGAMELLAEVKRARVVATYTDLPLLPPLGSSGICRIPITMPTLDMNTVMQAVPELRINIPSNSSRRFDKKLATLRLRLGMKIRQLGMTSVLHVRQAFTATETFLADFQSAAALVGDEEQALEACIDLCRIPHTSNRKCDPNVAALLLGIPDNEIFSDVHRQLSDLQVVGNGLLTTSLENLLSRCDPEFEVYNEGRNKFVSILSNSDYLSNTPLEAAYVWVLATKAAKEKFLQFYERQFTFMCNELKTARLFPGGSSSICETAFLKQGVLYCADERNGQPIHPLADIFFITKKMQLVLVDVTGGDDKKVLRKRNKLLQWIGDNGGNINGYALQGVVLAPNDIGGKSSFITYVPNTNEESAVEVVRGVDARRQLGGLDQIFFWLE